MVFKHDDLAKKVFSLLDLTSLNETDDAARIAALCNKAQGPLGHVAAVCVFPCFVKQVSTILANTSIKIATVTNFPFGTEAIESVNQSIFDSIHHGAHEIDVVFPYVRYLAGEKKQACDFITECKKMCGEDILLKVILETGAIKDPLLVTEISQRVILAGADFLKTSTGKIATGATLEAATLMLTAIKSTSSQSVGFKASGGIRTIEQALQYIQLAEKIMGADWVNPEHFRLGASSLVDSI